MLQLLLPIITMSLDQNLENMTTQVSPSASRDGNGVWLCGAMCVYHGQDPRGGRGGDVPAGQGQLHRRVQASVRSCRVRGTKNCTII